jgi:NitT/TauT family transport system substrate-binding protein
MTLRLGSSLLFSFLLAISFFSSQPAESQSLKKVTIGISATNVNYLPFFVALRKGFYRDEGIDLQVIYMASTLTSKTVLTGDVDYSGAVSGVVGAAVQGHPIKVVMFTVARPLLFLISKKDITQPQQLKGKKLRGAPLAQALRCWRPRR